jgi:hypothetical protein
VVGGFPNMHKALGSISSTTQQHRVRRRERERTMWRRRRRRKRRRKRTRQNRKPMKPCRKWHQVDKVVGRGWYLNVSSPSDT